MSVLFLRDNLLIQVLLAIRVRAGGGLGGWGAAAPQNFGQPRFFGQQEKFGQSQLFIYSYVGHC